MAEIKSRASIMLDYKKATTNADYLKEAARAIWKESKNVGYCRADVMQAWQGDNANIFTGKMNMLSDELSRLAKQLEDAADVIKKNAKNIYDTQIRVYDRST